MRWAEGWAACACPRFRGFMFAAAGGDDAGAIRLGVLLEILINRLTKRLKRIRIKRSGSTAFGRELA